MAEVPAFTQETSALRRIDLGDVPGYIPRELDNAKILTAAVLRGSQIRVSSRNIVEEQTSLSSHAPGHPVGDLHGYLSCPLPPIIPHHRDQHWRRSRPNRTVQAVTAVQEVQGVAAHSRTQAPLIRPLTACRRRGARRYWPRSLAFSLDCSPGHPSDNVTMYDTLVVWSIRKFFPCSTPLGQGAKVALFRGSERNKRCPEVVMHPKRPLRRSGAGGLDWVKSGSSVTPRDIPQSYSLLDTGISEPAI
ncbi:hypothetical protein MYCTH_96290 [Thermothelomyces thermophilus ATCC 42464]|uniref:Uncharacterized protein n=1 Tax=Thermothelomyces thermophilus (strain ATCC 42464 / BCRC 31852 / DSM 1799) TaxID=573729 RepID=G2QIK7_THET4|nr:uncharacterized protein MYCTH_96290 [Thermothelomyces thermophilus ATCC 42464]AEO59538.1 hypothetical protein MYCTH_96290 [Thermothelomyces thermophilus ATCC 42464]